MANGFQLQKCNDLEDYIFCMQWDHVPLKFLFQFARLRTPNSNESTSTSAPLSKVIHPKFYKHLKEVAQDSHLGNIKNGLVSGR